MKLIDILFSNLGKMYAGNMNYPMGGQMGMMDPTLGANMVQLQMMGNNMNNNLMNRPGYFYFNGNSLSLQSRIQTLGDQELHKLVDINITVTGTQIQTFNTCSYIWTIVGGSLIIIPLFFTCCGWWKRCTFPAFDVPYTTYESLRKLLLGSSVRNLTLTVIDNCFDSQKAHILYEMISQSRIGGFTFINMAGDYDFVGNGNSRFIENMMPIKRLPKVISEIRWGTEIVL